jgi:hypothetical protein
MRINDLLQEMPIRVRNLNVTPEGGVSSFYPDDRKILNSPKALKKISDRWGKSQADVDLYLLDVGVDPEKALDLALLGDIGLMSDDETDYIANLSKMKEFDIQFDPKAISVILSNNSGAARFPLTAWMIAHRLFHTFQSDRSTQYHQSGKLPHTVTVITDQINGVLFDLGNYNPSVTRYDLVCLMGSSRACREGKLSNTFEFIPECFAQYILTGKVFLRPLPEEQYDSTSEYSLEWCNRQVKGLERFLNNIFAGMLNDAKGKIVAI